MPPKTPADPQGIINTLIASALHKRNWANQMLEEAEEELIQARIMAEDLKKGAEQNGSACSGNG